MTVDTEHRQNLHELIIGSQGVALNGALMQQIDAIEQHNRTLRTIAESIPSASRGNLNVDAFCALERPADLDAQIAAAERSLAAGLSSAPIQRQAAFLPLQLPGFDIDELNDLLGRGLPALEQTAEARVKAHLATLGADGASWVNTGVLLIDAASHGQSHEMCPFCLQDLSQSALLTHYRAYFSEAYTGLRRDIISQCSKLVREHEGEGPASFERAVSAASHNQEFWSSFIALPKVDLDSVAIAQAWRAAWTAVLDALTRKRDSIIEEQSLTTATIAVIQAFEAKRREVADLSTSLLSVNEQIDLVKEQAATASISTLEADLARLNRVKARHEPPLATACQAYLNEKANKEAVEAQRQSARAVLDAYRNNVFPAYQGAINHYLTRFNAGFRLEGVSSTNHRTGPSCTYNVLVNNLPVGLAKAVGAPSFRTALSAGDRNTLALAFFFASVDRDPNRPSRIVVIDDPMTSLDEHRSRMTVNEVRRLLTQVEQVIVLSHSKGFLCSIWHPESRTTTPIATLCLVRTGTGSTIGRWDVNRDAVTEHDKRHALVTRFLVERGNVDEREVASALRLILEQFARVAYPAAFPPNQLLGPFIGTCQPRCGTPNEVLNTADLGELRELLEYANQFHHETNPVSWQTVVINDGELTAFCGRTLRFCRRS